VSLGALIRGVSAPRNLISGLSRRCRPRCRGHSGLLPSARRRSRCSHRCAVRHGRRSAPCRGRDAAAASRSGKLAGARCARRPGASDLVMPTCAPPRTLGAPCLTHTGFLLSSRPAFPYSRSAGRCFQTSERNSNVCLRRKQGNSIRFPLSLRRFNSGNLSGICAVLSRLAVKQTLTPGHAPV
jgi:hypothetical protein